MAYDEGLAQRVRQQLRDAGDVEEKQMFGGIAFMLQGNMACGVIDDELMVRVGPEKYEELLAEAGASEFDFTGRPMKGWVKVSQDVLADDQVLGTWVERGIATARSLPPK